MTCVQHLQPHEEPGNSRWVAKRPGHTGRQCSRIARGVRLCDNDRAGGDLLGGERANDLLVGCRRDSLFVDINEQLDGRSLPHRAFHSGSVGIRIHKFINQIYYYNIQPSLCKLHVQYVTTVQYIEHVRSECERRSSE